MKRILYFLLTNIAIMVVFTISWTILTAFIPELQGSNQAPLLVFALIAGFGGSFIALMMSKGIAKRSVGAVSIENPSTPTEIWIVETVKKQAQTLEINMPEVAIYDSPEVNAFATGPSKNNSLVAVSTGLLNAMSEDEVEAVLGHEMGHVANGDMVTLTLIQGVVNTFVLYISMAISRAVSDKPFVQMGISLALQFLFGFIATIIVSYFSRRREFRADEAGASLAGTGKMIAALERLRAQQGQPAQLPDQMAAFGISGGLGQGIKALFRTHPPLEDRIEALRRNS